MDWKDVLLPGASRVPLPSDGNLAPGWVLDTYGTPTERNDWVMGPQGVPVISGSNEAQPGYTGPAPGANAALYQALASAQGQAAAAKAYADANLSSLVASANASRGPTIGGHAIDSAEAIPFLSALGQIPQETEEERRRREAQKLGLGASIPA